MKPEQVGPFITTVLNGIVKIEGWYLNAPVEFVMEVEDATITVLVGLQ